MRTTTGSSTTRWESDTLGDIEVPAQHLWGAHTERARRHFRISTERMPIELVVAIALVKREAARVNVTLGELAAQCGSAIVAAADEVLAGDHDEEFVLPVWQTGSATATHMNVNEVLANRASVILGGGMGQARCVDAHDHVNRGQSSNDVIPTAMHIALVRALHAGLLPALAVLRDALLVHVEQFKDLVKIGRTHLQDATPLTLGQEFSGYAEQLHIAQSAIERDIDPLLSLAIGATAVGTGLNAHPQFGTRMATELSNATQLPFVCAANRFAALAGHEPIVLLHGALKALAGALLKIANDLRWMASGPRCGLGELTLPANEPGSSIMPGKINPTQCEALSMVCAQVFGNDVTISMAAASGQFELNVFKPVIIYNALQSVHLLADAMLSFEEHCVRGLSVKRERLAANVSQSLMLVTALTPHIGYDKAAQIAQHAHEHSTTLETAGVQLGYLTHAQFAQWVNPRRMAGLN